MPITELQQDSVAKMIVDEMEAEGRAEAKRLFPNNEVMQTAYLLVFLTALANAAKNMK